MARRCSNTPDPATRIEAWMHEDRSTTRFSDIVARVRLDNPTPKHREECFVCGKYASICQWHHVLPVHEAAEVLQNLRFPGADTLRWVNKTLPMASLCPTHHRLFHAVNEKRGVRLHHDSMCDLTEQELRRFSELANHHARIAREFFVAAQESIRSLDET